MRGLLLGILGVSLVVNLVLWREFLHEKGLVQSIVKSNIDYLTTSLKTHSPFYYVKDEPWLEALAFNAYQQKIPLYPIQAVQYVSEKKKVMLVAQAEYSSPPAVYLFDTSTHSISQLEIEKNSRGFFTSSKPIFANANFDFSTQGGDAGCGGRQYFTYNATTNKIKLAKESSQCENQKEETWTYY